MTSTVAFQTRLLQKKMEKDSGPVKLIFRRFVVFFVGLGGGVTTINIKLQQETHSRPEGGVP